MSSSASALRTRPEHEFPRAVDQRDVGVLKADGLHARVIDRGRLVAVRVHPVDRALRIEPAIEQVVDTLLVDARAVESVTIERHQRLGLPAGPELRVTVGSGRHGARPQRADRREALRRARWTREAVGDIKSRRAPVVERIEREIDEGMKSVSLTPSATVLVIATVENEAEVEISNR